jgi:two-component system sensor histidine kinase PilS (NtrC family)
VEGAVRDGPLGTPPGAALRPRLLRLLAGRLALALAILCGALLVTADRARDGLPDLERGLYATIVTAFVATILGAGIQSRLRRLRAFAAAQLALDVALVSALVHFSGGVDSIFAFLYVPITVYAALIFGRQGAYAASGLGAAAYAVTLAIGHPDTLVQPVTFALWGINAGALLLVALLASALSRERDRAGYALAEKVRDLQSLRRLHERTVNSLTSGLLTTDTGGTITSFNPEAERITGVPAADAIGQGLDAVIRGASDRVLDSVKSSERGRARLRYRNRRDQELFLGLAGSVLRDAIDSPGGYVVIFQDVTKIVEMETDLRRHERLAAVGQLAADLAHEIRNPLAAISGSIQILEDTETGGESDESKRLMSIVVRETDRLNALITDFLHYARPAPAKPEPVAIATVLSDMRQIFETVRPPSVELTAEAPEGLCVLADDRQVRQLLWNLFLNAVQAMPDGGRLEIRAVGSPAQDAHLAGRSYGAEGRVERAEGPRFAEIRVTDTGAGISEDVLERIFDPFFTTKEGGSGLGLATVHRIVEGNGGHVSVESAVGRGTCFRVLLPIAENPR